MRHIEIAQVKMIVAVAVRNNETVPSMMPWLPPRIGSKANSNPIVQSCKMRVPTVICPDVDRIIFRSTIHWTTTAVDDIERKAPIKMPSDSGAPIKSAKTPHTKIISQISRLPPASETA